MDGVIQKVVIYALATFLAVGFGYSYFKEDSSIPKIQAFERVSLGGPASSGK